MTEDLSSLMNGHIKPQETTNNKTNDAPKKGENRYLAHPEEGLKLCASLISNSKRTDANSKHQDEIKQLIEHDFLTHAEHDDNTTGAKAYADLLQWQNHLAEAICFPQLEQSYTVAVGGSFSAGKTRFLTSVLGCPSLLPIDTTPTTSIPTYLFKGTKNSIEALNFYGKKTPIDEDALKAICHSFNTRYGVTFSHLLQLIAVQRQEFIYPNLIFLDTPGYSKADNIGDSNQNTDENVARAHLRSADYLIWLVDQQNGTVPKPDIDFIQSLDIQQPILIVISKADKRPENLIKEVIATAKTDLDRAEINYLDVIAYSAQNNTEISGSSRVLTGFLNNINQGKNGSTLGWQLNNIFNRYDNYYQSHHKMLSLTHKTVNEIIFDESISDSHREHLTALNKKTKNQLTNLRNQQAETKQIHQKLTESLTTLADYLGIVLTDNPSIIQLQSMSKQKSETVSEILCFDAMLQGNLNTLSHLPDLNKVAGAIKKKSPLGLFISIDADASLDVLIMQRHFKQKIVDTGDEKFQIGLPVTVQILNNKTCTVTIEL